MSKVDPSGLSPDDDFIDDAITGFWTVVGGITGGTLGGGGGAAVGVPTGPGAAATSVAGMVKGAAAGSAMGYAFGRWMVGLRHYWFSGQTGGGPGSSSGKTGGSGSGPCRSFFHKGKLKYGNGNVTPRSKPFSTGTSKGDVDAAVPGNDPVHEFRIPEGILQDWERLTWARRVTTSMNGRTITEYQFSSQAQKFLDLFRVK